VKYCTLPYVPPTSGGEGTMKKNPSRHCLPRHRKEGMEAEQKRMEATQDCTILWYEINIGVQNDQMLKVIALKFKS